MLENFQSILTALDILTMLYDLACEQHPSLRLAGAFYFQYILTCLFSDK